MGQLASVLRSGRRDGGESGTDAAVDRRAVSADALVRQPSEVLGVNRKRVQRLMRVTGIEVINGN
jgi:hypothetical protein